MFEMFTRFSQGGAKGRRAFGGCGKKCGATRGSTQETHFGLKDLFGGEHRINF